MTELFLQTPITFTIVGVGLVTLSIAFTYIVNLLIRRYRNSKYRQYAVLPDVGTGKFQDIVSLLKKRIEWNKSKEKLVEKKVGENKRAQEAYRLYLAAELEETKEAIRILKSY